MITDLTRSKNEEFILPDNESLLELERSYKKLKICCYNYVMNQDKLNIIRAFDCSYELTLEVLKKELIKYNLHVYSQVDILKEAFANKIILSSERWIAYLEKRDLINTSNDANVIDQVISIIPMFKYDLSELIEFLKIK